MYNLHKKVSRNPNYLQKRVQGCAAHQVVCSDMNQNSSRRELTLRRVTAEHLQTLHLQKVMPQSQEGLCS